MQTRKLTVFFLSISIHSVLNCSGIYADVLTYHNDNARTGWNPSEGVLTPGNVNASSFGLLFNLPVDGKVDAQPLCVSNAAVANISGLHNLVIVATEHDSVYAFDADSGALYWQVSLLGSGETPSDDHGCGQVTPEIGITATPVIDRSNGIYGTSGTIYVVAMSKSATAYHQRLHALNLASGQGPAVTPVEIQASYPGTGPNNDGKGNVIFDPAQYKERPGLLLLKGIVYTSWASHCDQSPYTGWIIGYDESTLAQRAVLNVDPDGAPNNTFLSDGSGNSFWGSGAGPAADANGYIYALTANGPFETTLLNGFPDGGDYGDSFLKLSTNGVLAVSDYFTPFDQAIDAQNDVDLGSGGVVVLPDMIDANGNARHLAVGAGKDANIYLVDRDNLGKYLPGATSNTYIYQELANALPGGEFATAAYFNGAIYYGPVRGELRRFTFTQARLNPSPAATTSIVFAYPGVTPSISSSGNNAGIVWAYENPRGGGQAVLHAYDAVNLIELYNSNQNPQRDQFGQANKFITPTICNGKVFVGTTNSVGVFGLLNSPPLPTPTPAPTPVPTPTPAPSFHRVAKDFNGDGTSDLVWENTTKGSHEIWLLKNGAPVGSIALPRAGLNWRVVGVGGIDGSANADLVWENILNGEHLIWLLKNGVPVGSIALPRMPLNWHVVGSGDFNGDGYADLVWESNSGARVIWFLKNGVPASSVSLPRFGGPQWHVVGVGDFNGNGQADLVMENAGNGKAYIWLLNNGTSVGTIPLRRVPAHWHIAGTGDFNGDGNTDLVLENSATGHRMIWLLKNGTYVGSIPLPKVPLAWHIVNH